jgi:hypothetical protein
MILKQNPLSIIFISSLFAVSLNAFGEDEILSLEGARIRGNQELPNVLYLIPWKPPKVYSLDRPETTLSTSTPNFKALDRGSFKRLVSYHETYKNEVMISREKNDLKIEQK